MKSLKKWSWDSFVFILLLAAIGLGHNKSTQSMLDWGLATLIFGVPFALIFAWMGKSE